MSVRPQTQLQTLISHLQSLWPDGGEIAGYPLQVIDGPGVADIRNNVLFIGHSIFSPTFSGASTQQWAAVGRIPPTRKEDLELNCALRVGIGNRDMAGCRQRAIDVFEALAYQLRADVVSFTGNGEFQQIQLARYRMYQEQTADGVSVTLEFTISAVARV